MNRHVLCINIGIKLIIEYNLVKYLSLSCSCVRLLMWYFSMNKTGVRCLGLCQIKCSKTIPSSLGEPLAQCLEMQHYLQVYIAFFINVCCSKFIYHNQQKISPLFSAVDLIEQLLTFDPSQRLSAESALTHSYVHQYHLPCDEPRALTPLRLEHEVMSSELLIPDRNHPQQ